MLRNTERTYGLITVLVHWVMALSIILLFTLGWWMVGLDYDSRWYIVAPDFHRNFGVAVFVALVMRFAWRLLNVTPATEPNVRKWEHLGALLAHWLIYLLVAAISITGYLMSTADGHPISVFGWFDLPATITSIEHQSDRTGLLHYYFSYALMGLVGLHALAALKHHFIDRDRTLLKMLGR